MSISTKFPTINPNQRVTSIITRDCKTVTKSTALPDFFNLEFIASNIPADVDLLEIKESLQKKTNLKEQLTKVVKHWAQHANDLSLKDDCVWLDGRLVSPLPLQLPVKARILFLTSMGSETCSRQLGLFGNPICTEVWR